MGALLEYRNCPSCGHNDFEVLFESNMNQSDFQEDIDTVYMLPGGKYGRHVKCRNCRLIYVNPIEKASKINHDYFKRESDDASIIRRSRLHAAESQVRLVKKYNGGRSLLDVGCGEGFFLFKASETGYITKGIELSQDATVYARREFGLDVEAKPIEESQFPQNCFDVATLWQVLEHVPYPLTILKEVHRILKPGGLLVASTPDIEGIPARILRNEWWNIRRIHLNQFTTKTLRNIIENAGFIRASPVSYRESMSLAMLVIPVLKRFGVYEHMKDLFSSSSIFGRTISKMRIIYPSRLDACTVIGFK